MGKPSISGRTPDDVIRAIYRFEKWSPIQGESRVARCKAAGWQFTADSRANRYRANRP